MFIKCFLYKMIFAVNKVLRTHIMIIEHPKRISDEQDIYAMSIVVENKEYVLVMAPVSPGYGKKEEKTSKSTINMVDFAAAVCGMN